MSSHFNYEIDEKRMRVKLRDMELPYREEAWTLFEEHCDGCKGSSYKSSSLPKFNLSLNRSVILPVVFGAVIILFSMLLFNFVSIKNKPLAAKTAKTTIEPKIDPPKKEIVSPPVVIDTVKVVAEQKKDTVEVKPEIVPTPPPPPVTVAVASPTVASVPQSADWTVTESGSIYKTANIASQVIGSANRNQTFKALEETNYFIRVAFGNNEEGYFRKSMIRKAGSGNSNLSASGNAAPKSKKRKAEVLESSQSIFTASSEEKEPELK